MRKERKESKGELTFKSLDLRNITKRFPGVLANDNISLNFKAGEIHALLGENGAGKTTLMNILYGIYHPDSGEIYINDQKVDIRSPRDAIAYGIGMVHQHFMLVQTHTVGENIALGFKDSPFVMPTREISKKIGDFCDTFGLKVDPNAKIWQLSAGEQQRAEIIKALLRGAKVLILDEPTSVLTPQEAEELFQIFKRMAESGNCIIFITHKLEEVFKISDRVTVLRQGKVIATTETGKTDKATLARMMVGRDISFEVQKKDIPVGEKLLEVNNLFVRGDMGNTVVKNISFSIHRNEIFGIAGVSGNGQRELVEAITGLRKVEKGTVKILDKETQNKNPRDIGELGVSHIPEERLRFGIVPNLPVYENVILRDYYRPPFSGFLTLNINYIKEYSKEVVERFSVMTPSVETTVKLLSGGNIQRLIIGREILSRPDVIIAAHPTYGLDIAATDFVKKLLLQKREEGSAILLVSEDLEEILQLSDTVGVMFMGEFTGIVKPRETSMEDMGLMMAGSKKWA